MIESKIRSNSIVEILEYIAHFFYTMYNGEGKIKSWYASFSKKVFLPCIFNFVCRCVSLLLIKQFWLFMHQKRRKKPIHTFYVRTCARFVLSFFVTGAIFRAIFDLSNKIALLILLRMFALYAESKKLKIDWRVIF